MLGEVASSVSLGRGEVKFGAEDKYASLDRLVKTRHFDGANYAYVDGHVKWLKKTAVDAVFQAQKDNKTGEAGATEAEAADLPIVFAWRIR